MGSTPRPHRFAIPMATRSTDVATLEQCPGKWMLTQFMETQQAEATYFELGSALHETIEATILDDLDLDTALYTMDIRLDAWIEGLEDSGKRVIETTDKTVDTVKDMADRMMRQWFIDVHPDSDKRLPIYDDYQWPPQVEHEFRRDVGLKYPIWGSVDAIFQHQNLDAGLAIVDWKSGKGRAKDFQLHFYEFGLALDVPAVGWFHQLDRKRKSAKIQMMEDDWPGTNEMLGDIAVAESTKQDLLDGWVEWNQDWWCNYCTVQEFCPVEGQDTEANDKAYIRMLSYAKPMTQPYEKKE